MAFVETRHTLSPPSLSKFFRQNDAKVKGGHRDKDATQGHGGGHVRLSTGHRAPHTSLAQPCLISAASLN